MTGAESANGHGEKPAGAWTAEETVSHMLKKLKDGKFYIVCPDNETSEVSRANTIRSHDLNELMQDLDRLRIKWAAGDIVEGRPALSRWHPEWKASFDEYVSSGLNHFEERRGVKERHRAQTPPLQGDNL